MIRDSKAETSQVVLVDDEEPVLRALDRQLKGEPFALRKTTRPEEALRWMRTEQIDVIVADYRMPGVSGIDLLGEAKRLSPRTARILLTGYPGQDAVMRGLGKGLYLLIGKPWDGERLKRVIRWHLRAGPRADIDSGD